MDTIAKRGRPRKTPEDRKADHLEIRIEASEKRTFKDAAQRSGMDLSSWVRERLRAIALAELDASESPNGDSGEDATKIGSPARG